MNTSREHITCYADLAPTIGPILDRLMPQIMANMILYGGPSDEEMEASIQARKQKLNKMLAAQQAERGTDNA